MVTRIEIRAHLSQGGSAIGEVSILFPCFRPMAGLPEVFHTWPPRNAKRSLSAQWLAPEKIDDLSRLDNRNSSILMRASLEPFGTSCVLRSVVSRRGTEGEF
jgi:hypothetical protein